MLHLSGCIENIISSLIPPPTQERNLRKKTTLPSPPSPLLLLYHFWQSSLKSCIQLMCDIAYWEICSRGLKCMFSFVSACQSLNYGLFLCCVRHHARDWVCIIFSNSCNWRWALIPLLIDKLKPLSNKEGIRIYIWYDSE